MQLDYTQIIPHSGDKLIAADGQMYAHIHT